MIKRIWATFYARSLEFLWDRSTVILKLYKMLLDLRAEPARYWINSDSQNGYFLDIVFDGRR